MVEATAARPRVPAVRASLARWLTYRRHSARPCRLRRGRCLRLRERRVLSRFLGLGSLALLLLVSVALTVGVAVELDTLDALFLGGFAGLAGWIALSLLWTVGVPDTVLEIERVLVYLAAVAAGILLLRKRSVAAVIVGLCGALGIISTYALLTRLFPDHFGTFDQISGYRLSDPLGYWNALGILAALGWLLALGLAARSGPLVRCLSAGSTVIFALTLYFTYGRASWIALFAGLTVAIALDKRRLQLITAALVLAPWSITAVAVASTSSALTHQGAALSAASRDGHGLAVIAIGLVVAASLTILLFDWLATVVTVPYGVRRVYAGTLLFLLAAFLIVVFGRYGFPPSLARKAYDSFQVSTGARGPTSTVGSSTSRAAAEARTGAPPGRRSRRTRSWAAAPAATPSSGSSIAPATGRCTTHTISTSRPSRSWSRGSRAAPVHARRAVRRGPAARVVSARRDRMRRLRRLPPARRRRLGLGDAGGHPDRPLLRDRAARRRPSRPRAAGTALRPEDRRGCDRHRPLRVRVVALLGNSAVSASSKSTDGGHYARAESQAHDAMSFVSWSAEPWRRLGEAQALSGNLAGARVSFRRAVDKAPRDWTLWYELALASRGVSGNARWLKPRASTPKTHGSGPRRDEGLPQRSARAPRGPDPPRLRLRRLPARRQPRRRGRDQRGLRARHPLPRELRPFEGRAARLAARHRAPLRRRCVSRSAAGRTGRSSTEIARDRRRSRRTRCAG